MQEKTLGEVIAEAREKKGLSQRQLAKEANINNSELSKIEAGIRKEPNPKRLPGSMRRLGIHARSPRADHRTRALA